MKDPRQDLRGRGALVSPANRFESQHTEIELQDDSLFANEEVQTLVRTQFIKDSSRTIVTQNASPDIGFDFSVNPYRGCEHGCAYCYARPTHEYLGYSAGLDFESKIMIKESAPELLREKLMSKSWEPAVIAMSGVTDCYQPVERKLELTRGCLKVLKEFRNPVAMITKNAMVTRDLDLLGEMAKLDLAWVFISVTTLDDELCGQLEPRTSRPRARLEAIRQLAQAGVPVGVNVAPVIPGLTDHEMPAILKAAAEAGAQFAGITPLRLPGAVLQIFSDWLTQHRPERKEKVLSQIRDLRGGNLNDAQFGSRMRGQGPVAENLQKMFRLYSKKSGLNQREFSLSTEHFQRPGDQLKFF